MNRNVILASIASLAVLATPLAASAATTPKPAHHVKHKAAKKVAAATPATTKSK